MVNQERGATAVELAVGLPIVLTLIFGAVTMGLVLVRTLLVEARMDAAARYLAHQAALDSGVIATVNCLVSTGVPATEAGVCASGTPLPGWSPQAIQWCFPGQCSDAVISGIPVVTVFVTLPLGDLVLDTPYISSLSLVARSPWSGS